MPWSLKPPPPRLLRFRLRLRLRRRPPPWPCWLSQRLPPPWPPWPPQSRSRSRRWPRSSPRGCCWSPPPWACCSPWAGGPLWPCCSAWAPASAAGVGLGRLLGRGRRRRLGGLGDLAVAARLGQRGRRGAGAGRLAAVPRHLHGRGGLAGRGRVGVGRGASTAAGPALGAVGRGLARRRRRAARAGRAPRARAPASAAWASADGASPLVPPLRPLAGVDEGTNSTPWALAMIAPMRSALRSRWMPWTPMDEAIACSSGRTFPSRMPRSVVAMFTFPVRRRRAGWRSRGPYVATRLPGS